jgi:hypothetical protein
MIRARRLFAALPAVLAAAAALPGFASAAKPNPCLTPGLKSTLLCPDLVMSRPFDLTVDRKTVRGHVLLRAGNSINNIGTGPAEIHGVRTSPAWMKVRQRIYRRKGGRMGISTTARLYFKYVAGQTRYWKWSHAAQFSLWRRNSVGDRVKRVRIGRKAVYCLRDLEHTRPFLTRSPRTARYPGCNTSGATKQVTLGTSVGWSDVYPSTYPEQWIDVSGLRGCFDYVQTADPDQGLYESNENNNSAYATVRLPFHHGKQHCPGRGVVAAPRSAPEDPTEKY